MGVIRWLVEWLLTTFSSRPFAAIGFDADRPRQPVVRENLHWTAKAWLLSANENRPGLKKIYVWVTDDKGAPLGGVKVRFDVESGRGGVAYDHPHVWGVTSEQGYLEWNHLGVPTRYLLWLEDEVEPLVENIRTDLGYEYPVDGVGNPTSWRPINKPGVYSIRVEVRAKGW